MSNIPTPTREQKPDVRKDQRGGQTGEQHQQGGSNMGQQGGERRNPDREDAGQNDKRNQTPEQHR